MYTPLSQRIELNLVSSGQAIFATILCRNVNLKTEDCFMLAVTPEKLSRFGKSLPRDTLTLLEEVVR